ncbi:hypothetical protein [Flavobacterium sp.]|nr:hypothetical protein [Flavobacterium sp.]
MIIKIDDYIFVKSNYKNIDDAIKEAKEKQVAIRKKMWDMLK